MQNDQVRLLFTVSRTEKGPHYCAGALCLMKSCGEWWRRMGSVRGYGCDGHVGGIREFLNRYG